MKINILFLIRAYNDLDHLAPVMWKAAKEGFGVNFFFVSNWRTNDYRIALCNDVGAKEVSCELMDWYHHKFRDRLGVSKLRTLCDIIFGMLPGIWLLLRTRTQRIVVEWCGPSGREMAKYFLVPGRYLGIRRYSFPHGYHVWCNKLVTWGMVNYGGSDPRYDFSDRNRYTQYVVQSDNIKCFFLDRKIDKSKISVVGSARFCPEWAKLNLNAAMANEKNRNEMLPPRPNLIFFLGHWGYRVNKPACLGLLEKLSLMSDVHVIVKGHSRGDLIGGLSEAEKARFESQNLTYAGDGSHSNILIARSEGIICFGSSIVFEAIIQAKPVCNPCYLTENLTIFSGSKIVFDAHCENDVLSFVKKISEGRPIAKRSMENLEPFFLEHVYGGKQDRDVLSDHVRLLC